MNFHKHEGKANPYVCFGYVPHTICNNTQEQVSVSMNNYLVNSKHTNQQSTKEVLFEEVEGSFR